MAPADTPERQVFKWDSSAKDYEFDEFNTNRWPQLSQHSWGQFVQDVRNIENYALPSDEDCTCCSCILCLLLLIMAASLVTMFFTLHRDEYWYMPFVLFGTFIISCCVTSCVVNKDNSKRKRRLNEIKKVVNTHNTGTFREVGYNMLIGNETAWFQLVNEHAQGYQNPTMPHFNQNYNNMMPQVVPSQNTNYPPPQYGQQPAYGQNVNVNYPSYTPAQDTGKNNYPMGQFYQNNQNQGNQYQGNQYELPLIEQYNVNP